MPENQQTQNYRAAMKLRYPENPEIVEGAVRKYEARQYHKKTE